ncbi:MAG: VWA domain-containing protein [Pseudomonadota bacterium]
MSFSTPAAFALLLLPILVLLLRKPTEPASEAVYLPPALAGRMMGEARGPMAPRSLAPVIIWGLIVVALAGPQRPEALDIVTATGRDIVLTIDLSGSMEREDFEVDGAMASRLEAVKTVAERFVEGRVGDRVGVVVFGNEAYTAAPLTHDVSSVARTISNLSIGVSGRSTAISDGLGLALKRLSGGAADSQVVILLSDGIDTTGTVAPSEAAVFARALGVRIHTIALDPVALEEEPNPNSVVDAITLARIASESGGTMFHVKTTAELEEVAATVNELEPSAASLPPVRAYRQYWIWPAAAALVVVAFVLGSGLVSGARALRLRRAP